MSPALVFTLVLVLGSAAAFHAAFGRTARGFGLAVLAALTGFVVGEALLRWLGGDRWLYGQINLLPDLAGAWIAMGLAWRWGPWR